MLSRSAESENPSLVPDIREKTFNLLPLSMAFIMYHMAYCYVIMLKYAPSMPNLLNVFIINGF